jgi:prepilin peptidase CpaA
LSTTSNFLVLVVVLACAGGGAAIDLRTRRIPNSLTVTSAVLGLGLAAGGWTGVTLGSAALGLALGVLLMLPGHVLGGTGAGDVKMLGAMGTVLGARGVVMAFLYTAIAGGALALVVAGRRRRLGATLRSVASLAAGGPDPDGMHPAPARVFPYGPAIALGCALAVLWGG